MAGLLVLLVATAGYALVQMNSIGDEMQRFTETDAPLLEKIAAIETGQLEQHLAMERAVIAAIEKRDHSTAVARFQSLSDGIETDFAAAGKLLDRAMADSTSQRKYREVRHELKQLHDQHREFERHADELFRVVAKIDPEPRRAMVSKIEVEAETLDRRLHASHQAVLELSRSAVVAAESHERSALQTLLVLVLAGLICGSVVSWAIVRRMSRAIEAVTVHASALKDGDLTVDALDVSSDDELGVLARTFNEMAGGLAGQVRETRNSVDALTGAAMEILGAAKQQAAATQEQAATIQQITASLEEIGQSGAQISSRARDVGERATRSSEASETGREAMRETCGDMESIRVQVEDVAENIVALSEKTQAVGEIIAAVNDIAEQSNLLALNAAIEAAAAGDHGARFSVVANEIKSLADQAKDSTGQVRKILSEIQKGIHAAVMLTEEAVKRADAGKTKAESTEASIEEVLESTRESVQTFQQIMAGSNQQQIGLTQITQGMQDIRQAAEQSAAGTAQLEGAVSDLTALGQQLKCTVADYVV